MKLESHAYAPSTLTLMFATLALGACSADPSGHPSSPGGEGGSGGDETGGSGGAAGRGGSGGNTAAGGGGANAGAGGTSASGGVGPAVDAAAGGTGGVNTTGGASGSGGATAADAREASAPADASTGTLGDAAKLQECPGASVDRLQVWIASGEGTTVPATGNILVKQGTGYVAKVEFVKSEWHVVPVFIANVLAGGQVDLSRSSGFQMTYSATQDLWVQMRPAFQWTGGKQYLTKMPGTGGALQTRFFPFAKDAWTSLPALGRPTYTFESTIKAVRGLVFVGDTANTLVIQGLRFDGYVPACRAR